MVVTRSKTTLKEPVDTHTALEKELSLFSSHSLSWFVRFAPQRGTRPDIRTLFSVSWAAKPRHNTKSLSRGADQSNAKLLSLPLDVLATIFTYCHPTSLLQLSRTSHALHSFLTSRGSTSIWVSARKARTFTVTEEDKALVGNDSHYSSIAVGTWELPRCPSYMSEAAYAALLYIEICSVSGLIAYLQRQASRRPFRSFVKWAKVVQSIFVSMPEFVVAVTKRTSSVSNTLPNYGQKRQMQGYSACFLGTHLPMERAKLPRERKHITYQHARYGQAGLNVFRGV